MPRAAHPRPSSTAGRRGAALLTSLTLIASLLGLAAPQAAVAEVVADPSTLSLKELERLTRK